ncbi:MAG: DNA-binding protein [Nitrosopumilaceae archaeon]|nr:DNA-binding protein [Nitrosopumilaceae archaeon]
MSFPDSDDFQYNQDDQYSKDNQNDQYNEAEFNAQKEQILKNILAPEARMRLNNVKMVKKELAEMVENYLITMATQGKINSQISDDQLKQILLSVQQPKRDFKINRR